MASKTLAQNRTFTFLWQIENFNRFVKGKCFLMSPCFKSFNLNSSKWNLKINLKLDKAENEYICVGLLNETLGNACDPLFSWECSILDGKEAPIFTTCVRDHDFRKLPLCDLPTGPLRKDIIVTQRSRYLPDDTLTIRLGLWKSADKSPDDDEYCTTRTVIGLDRSCILWDIEGFSLLELNQEVKNSIYFPNSDSSATISFSLEENTDCFQSLLYSLVNLSFSVELNKLSFVSCKISLLDKDKKKIKFIEDECTYAQFLDSDVWVIREFLTRREILSKAMRCLKEDVLSLLLEFEVHVNRNLETTYYRPADLKRIKGLHCPTLLQEGSQTSQNLCGISELKKDKVTAFEKIVYLSYDFKLYSGTTYFPVHKLVLSAKSRVFRDMFYGDKRTNDPNRHSIQDLDYKTLKNMLNFLYGNPIQLQGEESMFSLYNAAIEYQVQSLKEHCFYLIKPIISVLNVSNILLLADKDNNERLKSLVYDFLMENMKEVLSSQSWKEFCRQNLALTSITLEVLNRRVEKKTKNLRSSSPLAKNDKPSSSSESEPHVKKSKLQPRRSSSPHSRTDISCRSTDNVPLAKKDEQMNASESEPDK